MAFDFSSALVWLQGIGLGALLLVAVGFALKKAGIIDSIWGVLSKFVDWTISAFNALVFSAPPFIRVGLFLILFSLLGAVIVPLTVGVYGVCDSQGQLWVTDNFFEGFSAQTLPDGLLPVVDGKSVFVADTSSYMSSKGLPVVSVDDEGVLAVAGSETPWYAVCYSNSNDTCYVKRVTVYGPFAPDDACSSVADAGSQISGEYVTMMIYYYKDVELQGDGDYTFYSVGEERHKVLTGLLANGGVKSWDSLNECKENAEASIRVSVQTPRSVTNIVTFGLFGDAGGNYSGYVSGVETSVAADKNEVSARRFSALRVKDEFLSREGAGFIKMDKGYYSEDVVTYSCGENNEKSVLVFGMDVFNPVYMVMIVVVGGLIWLAFKLR